MSLNRGVRQFVTGIPVSAVLVAILLLGAAPALATHGGGHSWSDMTIDVECRSVSVTSSRSISKIEVFFADGTSQVFDVDSASWTRTFDKDVKSATATSGSEIPSTISDTAGACSGGTTTGGTTQGTGTTGGVAQMAVDADCRAVTVTSSDAISYVEVFFVDGTSQRFENVGAKSWTRTFDKDVKSATSASGSTVSTNQAGPCQTTGGTTTTGTSTTGTAGTTGGTTGTAGTTGGTTTGTAGTGTTGAGVTEANPTGNGTTGAAPDQVAGVVLDRPVNNPATPVVSPAPAAAVRTPARPQRAAAVNSGLAATGSTLLPLAATGFGSVATGVAALAAARRRRGTDTIDIAERLVGHVL